MVLASVASFFLALLLGLGWVRYYDQSWLQQQQGQTAAQAAIFAAELERELGGLIAVGDLAADLLRSDRGDVYQLKRYGQEWVHTIEPLVAVALAPNGELDRGLEQQFATLKVDPTIREREITVGPVTKLTDGRRIVTAIRAVYLPDAAGETWWGSIVLAVDLDKLIKRTGLSKLKEAWNYRLVDSSGSLMGGSSELTRAMTHPVSAPGVSWRLQLSSVESALHAPYVVLFSLFVFFLAALVGRAVYILFRQPELIREKVAQKTNELERLAYYDALTGLGNRKLFQERLKDELVRVRGIGGRVAILYLDLDHFKRLNDSLGHSAGDALLRSVADRLRTGVRHGDSVARVGGDEFTVTLNNLDAPEHAGMVARKLLDCICEPLRLEGQDLYISVSIGITIAPEDGTDANELMKNADVAMYHAKSKGRNNFQFYNRKMNLGFLESVSVERELRRALSAQEFALEFQPLLALGSRQLFGMEALLRWRHPDGTTKTPSQFIGVAEETGLIVPLGRWMMREAMRKTAELCQSGLGQLKLALNLSPRQLRDPDLYVDLQNALKDSGLHARQLILEVTEDALFDNLDEAVLVLKRLKSTGVSIAIDDFGTGYASLTYLKKLPVDIVKIDREFVRELPQDQHDAEIVASVINMTHKLGMNVVAEGIERPEQMQFLVDNRCDMGQGFLFQDEEEMLSIWLEAAETGFRVSSLA